MGISTLRGKWVSAWICIAHNRWRDSSDHGLDRSVLRSEMSFGHFGVGAEVPGHFGRISAEVSQCRTVSGHNCPVKAKFHYTNPTEPTRTQRSFAAKKSVRVRSGPCRVSVVEFSSSPTMCADFVRVRSGISTVPLWFRTNNLSCFNLVYKVEYALPAIAGLLSETE